MRAYTDPLMGGVHGHKNPQALRRCGGTDGRATTGHMPGSGRCVCARKSLLGGLQARNMRPRRRMPHICGMCNRGVRLQGFLSGRFVKGYRLFLILAKRVRSEEAPHKTWNMRILCAELAFD